MMKESYEGHVTVEEGVCIAAIVLVIVFAFLEASGVVNYF